LPGVDRDRQGRRDDGKRGDMIIRGRPKTRSATLALTGLQKLGRRRIEIYSLKKYVSSTGQDEETERFGFIRYSKEEGTTGVFK